jgi:hypothetical protein
VEQKGKMVVPKSLKRGAGRTTSNNDKKKTCKTTQAVIYA